MGDRQDILVKQFLKRFLTEGELRPVYVSLFGLSTLDEIDEALLRAIHPTLGWRVTRIAARMAKVAAKHFNIDPAIQQSEIFDKFKADLYIFDDLERCEMPISKTLGYINEFVEHDGCKVVIVANEAEIGERDEYLQRREKLIGKVLEVQSSFGEALKHFTSLVDDPSTKLFLSAKATEISSVYHQSGLNNLRILQQTMWDFERVHRALTDVHRHNDIVMASLLRLFFALSFEVKAGRLEAADLVKRANKITIMMAERYGPLKPATQPAEPTRFLIAHKRYVEMDLGDTILPDEVLIDVLVKGIVDEQAIRAALNQSIYFAVRPVEPAWITVWNMLGRTDEEFNAAYSLMEQQFAERQFTAEGEVLQVFGLRFWLAEIGVLEKGRPDIVMECKLYIDDLYDTKRLGPISRDRFEGLRPLVGWGGYPIRESEAADFQEVYAYFKDRGTAAYEDRYPERATELLKDMKADSKLFARQLNFSEDGVAGRYHNVPVLTALEPDLFVSTFLTLHPKDQAIILAAFQARYDQSRLDGGLARELPWLGRVRDKLVEATDAMSLVGRYRLKSIIEQSIDRVLGRAVEKSL